MKFRKLYIWLLILVVATPLGLLASGSVWGEWGSDEVKKQIGFAPKGMKSLESLWSGLLGGYNVPGFNGFLLSSIGYIISAVLGVGLIFIIFKLISLSLPNESKDNVRGTPLAQANSQGCPPQQKEHTGDN